MTSRLRVGVLFGGKSGEHEVALVSAESVIANLDRNRYEVIPIGITKHGKWVHHPQVLEFLKHNASKVTELPMIGFSEPGGQLLVSLDPAKQLPEPLGLDLVFPVLHGTFGEDGTVQGLLELADIPYVGSGVTGSATGMDKIIMKRIFKAYGLPIVNFVETTRRQWRNAPDTVLAAIEANLSYPVFVKPANLGSSVGISKAKTKADCRLALDLAARYDRRLIIEQAVPNAREIEIGALGNEQPMVSIAGEVNPSNEFYDYNAKYVDGQSSLAIPAELTPAQRDLIASIACQAFTALDLAGLARVDFLINAATDEVFLSEVNTMPGFTSISMYPRLWAASGLSYPQLLDRLIELALERHRDKRLNQTSFATSAWYVEAQPDKDLPWKEA